MIGKMLRMVGVAFAATTIALTGSVLAATPGNTLVQAWAIDDIISLDPAEIFEFTAAEIAGNSYDRLIGYDVNDVSKVYGVIAESWDVSADGKTLSFKIRKGLKFASGNSITAEDAVFSLQRAVTLDKSPAFILTQFGLSKDNVQSKIRQTGEYSFDLEMDKNYAPSFVLYCMTATIASVVDKKIGDVTRSRWGYGLQLAENQLCWLRPLQHSRLAGKRSRRLGTKSKLLGRCTCDE
jgi:peptide/nickel transport system substrate-binding protein